MSDTEDAPDYSADLPIAQPPASAMAKLQNLTREALKLKLDKLELEAKLATIDKQLETYIQTLIPGVMEELGADEIKIRGMTISVKDSLVGTFPKDEDKRREAFSYLRKTGNDGLIKREISVKYGRNSTEQADQLMALIAEHPIVADGAEVVNREDLNHQSMLAFLRQEIRDGREVPLKSFGVYQTKVADIKLPKER